MSIYHFSAQMISRSDGRSSIAAASYRAAEKMTDERTGLVFDFRQKKGVDFKQIFLPKDAPRRLLDRATLWREVEEKETRKNSQTAREINVALPVELTREQQIDLAQRFVKETFVDKGMIADLCVHDLDPDAVADDDIYNPHFHVMLVTRNVDESGFTTKNRDWNDRELLKKWREMWADYANEALEKYGFDDRIDHRTLAAQGIDREPQIHLGPARHAMQERGETLTSLEPQRERQRLDLKRAAQAAAASKIAEAEAYAEAEPTLDAIGLKLHIIEQQLCKERAMALLLTSSLEKKDVAPAPKPPQPQPESLDLSALLSDYIALGLPLHTDYYDSDVYSFMRDLIDYYELSQPTDLRALVDSRIYDLDTLVNDAEQKHTTHTKPKG